MHGRPRHALWLLLSAALLCTLLPSCGRRAGPFRIGMAVDAAPQEATIEGFKASMKAAGYVEGKTVVYLQNGYAGNDAESVRREVERVLAARPDALLALGRFSIAEGEVALRGKRLPMVCALSFDPVGEGLVRSIAHPDGNVTGVYRSLELPKMIEHLRAFSPATRVIYAPSDPTQPVSNVDPAVLEQARQATGMEIITLSATFSDGVTEAIQRMPEGSAILVFPTALPISGFVDAATKRRIPIASGITNHLEQGALFTFTVDARAVGGQVARLMTAIMRGVSPSELPMEAADLTVAVNLNAARAVGLDIDESTLLRADRILR